MTLWLKICGMTDAEAVSAALEAGADAIGFVFAPSVRQVTPAQAARLAIPARGRASCVAVTQHPAAELIAAIRDEFMPDFLQTDWQDLATVTSARDYLQSPSPFPLPVLRSGAPWPSPLPTRVLYEGAASGTGQVADWTAAAALARRCELILAGGLDLANVAAAIATVRPFGVDVSSGVEASPGRKSPRKILDFVAMARAAAAENGI